jgi:plastocyanin
MNDRLDSRALRFTDCYGQRFMKPGKYPYHVLPAGGHLLDREKPFVITVGERRSTNTMNQHTVVVRWGDRRFAPDKAEVTVEAGDLVVWNCPDPAAPAYVVQGEKEFFSSSRLVNECGYSHAFGAPGVYQWADAYGSGLGGVIRVTSPDTKSERDLARWLEGLGKATLVMIDKGEAQPREVEIAVGQTVYFAVTIGKGIAIAETRQPARAGGRTRNDAPA